MDKEFEYPRDFKGVWIPKEIYLDKDLDATEKILYSEISSLDKDESDGCWASNEYLANFCGCSKTKVSNGISKLIKKGYIHVAKFDGRKRWIKTGSDIKNEEDSNEEIKDSYNNESRLPENVRQKSFSCDPAYHKNEEINNSNNNIDINTLNNIDINAFNPQEGLKENINAFSSEKEAKVPSIHTETCTPDELANHIYLRCKKLGNSHGITDENKIKDITKTIVYFYQKYHESIGKHHPILSDKALERIFINYFFVPELLESYNITTFDDYKELIDGYFKVQYGKYKKSGVVPDYFISHFMSEEIRVNLVKNVLGLIH